MIKNLLAPIAAASLLCAAASASAASIVDTGSPDGVAVGSFAIDGSDWFAAEVDFATASQVDSVLGHVLGGSAGETFHVSLYADNGTLPGAQLYTATATFAADGWNGVAGLTGWNVAAGTYWVGLEVTPDDTLGSASFTGALLDHGAPTLLANTAYSSTGGLSYSLSAPQALSIGLRLDATSVSAVPWPASGPLMLSGLLVLAACAAVRRRRD
jgi:hypothetical protein